MFVQIAQYLLFDLVYSFYHCHEISKVIIFIYHLNLLCIQENQLDIVQRFFLFLLDSEQLKIHFHHFHKQLNPDILQ